MIPLWAYITYATGGGITWRIAGYHLAREFGGANPDIGEALGATVTGLLVGCVWPLFAVALLVRREPFLYRVLRDGKESRKNVLRS